MRALSSYFFTYFAFIGAISPYFALWLQSQGFSASDIGVLLAIPPAMRLVGPTSWGRLADRTGTRVKWLRLMAHASVLGLGVVALAVIFESHTVKLWLAALGLVLLHAMLSGQVPLTESLLLQKISPHYKRYGRVRLFGSLGFVVAVVLLGLVLDWLGIQWLLALAAGLLLVHMVGSWCLQDLPKLVQDTSNDKQNLWALVHLPHVPLFLVASFLMVFGHMAMYIYFSLYLEAVGYSKTLIGILWAISAVGEMVYFWWQPRFKSSPVTGYTRSYWIAVLRFVGFAWVAIPLGSPLWLLLVLQLLHTATFAVHHATSMALPKTLFPASAGSTANALFNTVSYGLAGSVGALACAWVWQSFGTHTLQAAQAVFTLSAISCLLGGVLAWRLRADMRLAELS